MGAVLAVLLLASSAAWAVPDISTPYPAVSVAAGDTLELDLEIDGTPGERVSLQVVELPEGWTASLQAGGFTVQAVTVPADEPATVTLDVQIPPNASGGTNSFAVVATSSEGTDRVPIEVTIAQAAASAVTLDAEFTTLTGAPEDTFTYDVTLDSDVPDETTFTLAARGPQGWQVTANPSTESRASSVTVAGGDTADISVEATPPPEVTAGTYPIVLEVSGAGRTASIELTAEVTGSTELALSTATERLNASGVAGETSTVNLVVTNSGSAPAQGVSMEASPPTDWEVEFEPATVNVEPGGSTTVQAHITPAEDAVVGDYVVTLTASGEQNNAEIELRYTVGTSGAWGLAAILVIIAVGVILYLVIHRYGRR